VRISEQKAGVMLIMDLVRTRIEWCGDVRYRESKEEIRSVSENERETS